MAEGKRKRRYDCDRRCVYFSSLPRKPRIACICERKTTRQVSQSDRRRQRRTTHVCRLGRTSRGRAVVDLDVSCERRRQ
jgi:hypothetical protein